jgi:hypothetical protein
MKQTYSILLIALGLLAYRISAGVVGGEFGMKLANFTPMVALALMMGAFLKRSTALAAIVGVQLVSDVVIAEVNGAKTSTAAVVYTLVAVASYALIAFAGPKLRRRFSWQKSLLSVAGATLGYQVLLNTLSFFQNPAYPKSLAGWVQCQTVGELGYTPTWVFLAKALLGNVFFAGLILWICRRPAPTLVVVGELVPVRVKSR